MIQLECVDLICRDSVNVSNEVGKERQAKIWTEITEVLRPYGI
jgi:hypothetical protein